MRCCVPFCKTTAEIVCTSKDITFHSFPREVHLRAAWLRALGKQDALLPADAVVCSRHFLDDEIYETESGSRQIRTGVVPATVLICLICLDTCNKLLLMSEHKLEQAYQHLVGRPPCGGGGLKRALCVRCAQRVVDFSTFIDESLQAHCLVTELLHTHEVITRRHVALLSRYKQPLPSDIEHDTAPDATATATDATDFAVAVKCELEHREDADTVACAYNERDYCKALDDTPAVAEAEAETQAPMKREHTCESESSDDSYQSSVASVVLATNSGYEDYPDDSSDDWDIYPTHRSQICFIMSFENNANVLEDTRKSQDTALIPKESLATISDRIDYRTTRRNDRYEESKHSQVIFGTQLENYTDRIQYICDMCQKIFQRKTSLVSHIRVHSFEKTLSCELLDCKLYQNPTLSSMSLTKTKHTEKPFACELCKYKCAYKSKLVRHMTTHTDDKSFGCNLCKYKFSQKSCLVRHMRTHTGEKPFSCKLCKYKCAKNSNLLNHIRTHTGEKPFACKLCKYKCALKTNLLRHMRVHAGEKPFACKLCHYKCASTGNLAKHMKTHTSEKPFACELCNYKCTYKSILVSHMRTHTGERPFACELCKYRCMVKSRLVNHMRTHTGEKPFACELCKYKCSNKSRLVIHMRTHTGEKPYACKLCKYKFPDNSNLVNHMRTHTGERPFACEICKYKCSHKSRLVIHMRTHTGEKPFACKLCKYKCSDRSNLVKHMKTHTGEHCNN